jgi:hypothetical protein
MANAIAEVFTNFIQFSQVLISDGRYGSSMRRPPVSDLPIAQNKRVTNGAFAMQAAPCGHRAGISG